MFVSQNSIPFTSNWLSVLLFALFVLPLGRANAEEGKDWSAERREYEERVDEFAKEVKDTSQRRAATAGRSTLLTEVTIARASCPCWTKY